MIRQTKVRSAMASALSLLLTLLLLMPFGAGAAETGRPVALVLTIKGAIGPATGEYLHRGLAQARARGAALVILQLDTPGGLVSTTREIIREILAAPMPVVGLVSPRGAHAASAGTYILMATHIAAMAPGTNIGAATPIEMGNPLPGSPGREPDRDRDRDQNRDRETPKEDGQPDVTDDPGAAKAINDLAAYIRSLAELRGRNVEWAVKAVREADSLSAQQALDNRVIELIADDIADLLTGINGRTVTIGNQSTTLRTDGLRVERFDPDFRLRVLATLTDPNIAFILMMIGIYGLIFEMANPGSVVPGVLGGICLLLGLYAVTALPLNYAGLAMLALGVAFMVAEAFVTSFGVLGVGGAIAFAIGATMLFDADVPGLAIDWPVVALATGASLAFVFLVLATALQARRNPVATGREALVNFPGTVVAWSGRSGLVHVQGEDWRAVGPVSLTPGAAIRVARVDGLTLHVERDADAEISGADADGSVPKIA